MDKPQKHVKCKMPDVKGYIFLLQEIFIKGKSWRKIRYHLELEKGAGINYKLAWSSCFGDENALKLDIFKIIKKFTWNEWIKLSPLYDDKAIKILFTFISNINRTFMDQIPYIFLVNNNNYYSISNDCLLNLHYAPLFEAL